MNLNELQELTKLVANTADNLEDKNKAVKNAYNAGLERGFLCGVALGIGTCIAIYFFLS